MILENFLCGHAKVGAGRGTEQSPKGKGEVEEKQKEKNKNKRAGKQERGKLVRQSSLSLQFCLESVEFIFCQWHTDK